MGIAVATAAQNGATQRRSGRAWVAALLPPTSSERARPDRSGVRRNGSHVIKHRTNPAGSHHVAQLVLCL